MPSFHDLLGYALVIVGVIVIASHARIHFRRPRKPAATPPIPDLLSPEPFVEAVETPDDEPTWPGGSAA